MIEELWSELISWSEQFIVPDWGELVDLIPILLAALVALFLGWTIYRFATAGPTRRGKRKLPPVPPPGTHLPGPSFAPILAAIGVLMLGFGMVAGGPWLGIGALMLVVGLLYWGREALRDYDQVVAHDGGGGMAVGALPAPSGKPPVGVHIPAPSFRPLLVAIALTLLVAGMVIGGWALLLGVVAVLVTGLGWLRDARREYTAVEEADRTGHLEAGGSPGWPKATLAILALILVAGVVLTSGILPNSGGGSATASGAPPAGEGTGGEGGGGASGGGGSGTGGEATPGQSLPAGDAYVSAKDIAFLQSSITVPAGRPFTIVFENLEAVPHNVAIQDASGADLFTGEVITGPRVIVYQVPALTAGEYPFICTVHPTMTGTVTAE
jgi:plastocyanin